MLVYAETQQLHVEILSDVCSSVHASPSHNVDVKDQDWTMEAMRFKTWAVGITGQWTPLNFYLTSRLDHAFNGSSRPPVPQTFACRAVL